jgi:hypothetical protein
MRVGWVGDERHVVFGRKFPGEMEVFAGMLLQQPGPKSLRIFMQSC